jgi:hypothetical protein
MATLEGTMHAAALRGPLNLPLNLPLILPLNLSLPLILPLNLSLPLILPLILILAGCSGSGGGGTDNGGMPDPGIDSTDVSGQDVTVQDPGNEDQAGPDSDLAGTPDSADEPDSGPPPRTFVAVTFNTGTSEGMGHDSLPDDGYTGDHAKISDEYYGDGLSWLPAVTAARQFLKATDPDVVVFQEIFHAEDCLTIPEDKWPDFFCESWTAGMPTVAQDILGEGWQVACHPGKPDKCAAVNRRFGTFRGCEGDFCLEGLDGFTVVGCGKGGRVGRGVIDLVDGGTLTLVNVHGSSGISNDDKECRVKQIDQVFVDLGDGEPGANGERNLVMGDLNTDPGRLAGAEASAARWLDFVGDDKPFHFVTEIGEEATPTYGGFINIDHVMSDAFDGDCWAAGVTEGHPRVIDAIYFDHVPIVCTLREIER